MGSEITFTFGQLIGFLFAILGMAAIIVFIILMVHVIKLVSEAKVAVKEIPATTQYVREKVDNIFGVAGTVGDTFGKITAALGIAERFERFTAKSKKKRDKK